MPQIGPALQSRVFHLARQGHNVEECQDAAAASPERGRFAVADGASESSFAALWARMLAQEFVFGDEELVWANWLPPLQHRWASAVEAQAGNESLPWYLEDRLREGAFATFLGLEIRPLEESWGWQGIAVGDSCLFQTRAATVVEAFPLDRSADFDSTPWLVGSRTTSADQVRRRTAQQRGTALAGDRFWLMTDALAQWFLRQVENNARPWDALNWLWQKASDALFAQWIEEQRAARLLRNDDVTLVGVCVE
jgi:hypothetical protein